MQPYEMDLPDYIESRGGVYLPFPAAVEFCYQLEWCRSIWEALLAGTRPRAQRVAEMLCLQTERHLYPYLPPEIAVDYPELMPEFSEKSARRKYRKHLKSKGYREGPDCPIKIERVA